MLIVKKKYSYFFLIWTIGLLIRPIDTGTAPVFPHVITFLAGMKLQVR